MALKPEKLKDLLSKVREAIDSNNYFITKHALERQNQRSINLPAVLHVLKTGHEEKKKSYFDKDNNTWKYAIRGKPLRSESDVRVIIAFDENQMLIITVMHIEGV